MIEHRRVLLVDDSPSDCRIFKDIIGHEWSHIKVRWEHEPLMVHEMASFDAVFVDYMGRSFDGAYVAQALHAYQPDIKGAILTDYAVEAIKGKIPPEWPIIAKGSLFEVLPPLTELFNRWKFI